jgi:hypothetical protein
MGCLIGGETVATQIFACGCAISESMYGIREILSVHYCWQHGHLYSQDKTNRQMAAELRAIPDHEWREMPPPHYPEGAQA